MAAERDQTADIPVIDLNSPAASEEIMRAATAHGFIFVKHNAIDRSELNVKEMFAKSRELFAAPTSVKQKCAINASGGKNKGWVSMGTEALNPGKHERGDFKEAFNVGEYLHGKPQQPLPTPLVPFEHELGLFMEQCHDLCKRVLDLLAIALKIPDDQGGARWFSQRHDQSKGPSGSIMRLLYYPALPASAAIDTSKDIRAGAHSDYGSVTLLFRLPNQPGLEILTAQGDWAPVPVNPESVDSDQLPILVNIGDLLSFWTSGLLKSTVHRVIFPKPGEGSDDHAARYSIAYFCHPADDTKLAQIPSPIIAAHIAQKAQQEDPQKDDITARSHLNGRLAETYGFKSAAD